MPARPRPSRGPPSASARTPRRRRVRECPERELGRPERVATIRSGSPRDVRVVPAAPHSRGCPDPTRPLWAGRGPTRPRWAGHAPIRPRCPPSVPAVRVSAPVDPVVRPVRRGPAGRAADQVRDRAPAGVRPAEASAAVRQPAAVIAAVPEVRVARRAAQAPATAVVPAAPGPAVVRTAVARAPAHLAAESVDPAAVLAVAAVAAAPVVPSAGAAASRGVANPSARSGRSSTTSPRPR